MRHTVFMAVASLLVVTAAGAQGIPPLTNERYTLDNGLTVILHEDRSTPMVAVNVWYRVGSGDEQPGRTGFAHLFEHVMFMGSQNVPERAFDQWLEAAGANNNGSTTRDRTNYYEWMPSNALPLALWLEADRMGWLLPTMDQAKLDLQRDVVKNERRQSYDNVPYGRAFETILAAVFPAGHPYSWPTIGSMADLSAASLEDVKQFFRTYYAPNNATLAIAGDFNRDSVKVWVERYFGEIPRGPGDAAASGDAGGRRSPRTRSSSSRTRCSCRACTTRGRRRKRFTPMTPRSISSRTFWRATRTRGSTSVSSTKCRSRRMSAPSR